ncbi:FAD dependent oxidoreductase [Cladorrhinum sp. PSN259]|nr:FAD dependent oxidoreductase [Cladorrhinum sp. PSN259]
MATNLDQTRVTYLIIGSGVFGASTALHLAKSSSRPPKVILLDRDHYSAPRRVAASWDWNKVIRCDYPSSPLHTRLALEAQQLWRNDPLFSPYYHECGSFWASRSNFRDVVEQNLSVNGNLDTGAKVYSVEEAKKLYGGVFEHGDYTGVEGILVNTNSGYAEAKEVLEATIKEAVSLGVEYLVGKAAILEFEGASSDLRVTGVRLRDDLEVIKADKVVLCTGAYTAKLLMDSDRTPGGLEIYAGDRIMAVGVTEGLGALSPEAAERCRLDKLPIGVNDNPGGKGFEVGSQPLPKLNAFKYWGHTLFRNTVKHPVSGLSISAPPVQTDYAQYDVPQRLKEDVDSASSAIYGPISEICLEQTLGEYRICWDGVTPTRDFIISPHSAVKSLFIATGGSFHGFKFLPIIGKYVVQMLSGELDVALKEKWAWDREMPMVNGNDYFSAEYNSLVS